MTMTPAQTYLSDPAINRISGLAYELKVADGEYRRLAKECDAARERFETLRKQFHEAVSEFKTEVSGTLDVTLS